MATDIKQAVAASSAFTLTMTGGITDGSGRMSDAIANASPSYPGVLIFCKVRNNTGAAANANSVIEVYLIRSDASSPNITDDNAGTSDAAFTPVNSQLIGVLVNKSSPSAGDTLYGSFYVANPGLKFSIGIKNRTGQTLSTTAGDHSFRYQFVNDQIQ